MKCFRRLLSWDSFFAVYFLGYLAALFYVSIRMERVLEGLWDLGSVWPIFGAQLIFTAFYASQMKRVDTSRIARAVSMAGYLYFCFLLYSVCLLLCADLLNLLAGALLSCLIDIHVFLWSIAFIIAAGVTLYGSLHARQFRHVSYTIPCGARLDNSCRIVLLSDLHIGLFVGTRHIAKMVDEVNGLHPELVVIAGDIFNNGSVGECWELESICGSLQNLRTTQGVFAVLGNHDPSPADKQLQAFFKNAGIHLLLDDSVELPEIWLVGRDDLLRSGGKRLPLAELLASVTGDKPVVVMDHSPDGFEEAAQCGASMVLSGHTHRGQFFPVTLLTKLFHPPGHFYGHTQLRNTHGIISAGTGYFQLPIRVGTDSEIVTIELIP